MPEGECGGSGQDEEAKWSWIGPRSPLISEKEESEWLLEKLFQRLDESLKDHWEEHRRDDEKAKQKQENHADGRDEDGHERGEQDGTESWPSSATLDRGESEALISDRK
jgi:potassium channel subfamily K, other eukaryote